MFKLGSKTVVLSGKVGVLTLEMIDLCLKEEKSTNWNEAAVLANPSINTYVGTLCCRVTHMADFSCGRHPLSLCRVGIARFGVLWMINCKIMSDIMEDLPRPSCVQSLGLAHLGRSTVSHPG